MIRQGEFSCPLETTIVGFLLEEQNRDLQTPGLGVVTERSHSHSVSREVEKNSCSGFRFKMFLVVVSWMNVNLSSNQRKSCTVPL